MINKEFQYIPYRQIHLDFHTSGYIENVAEDFDPENFASTLKKAKVQSVTCFARCHHGYLYYDSKQNPERKHPHLNRNLLAEQIEACHKYGIRVPIYTTVQWDDYTAQRHPEWLVKNKNGTERNDRPNYIGFYRALAVNSDYRIFLRNHIIELLDTFPCDGLFFDIVNPKDDWSEFSLCQMREKCLDPNKDNDRYDFGVNVINEWTNETSSLIRQYHPNATIFYNSGHIGPRHRKMTKSFSHFEIESLPSGGWGYLHMPMTSRYARTLGTKSIGMTGKFHTAWGDFHSYKNKAGLEFECNHMIALNMGCSIGDQLHPMGTLCSHTYDLINSVYSQLEKKNPWCENAKSVTEIAVLNPEEYQNLRVHSDVTDAPQGVVRILQECGYQFDIIDSKGIFDLKRYKVIIMPDEVPVDTNLSKKLQQYIFSGGCILASYKSGLNPSGEAFSLSEFGVDYISDAPYCPDFIVPRSELGYKLSNTEYVMYERGIKVAVKSGSLILCDIKRPYFNREGNLYCSHLHAPADCLTDYPAVVKNERVIYLSHPVFTIYSKYAPLWCKNLVEMSLDKLLGRRIVEHNGPTTILVMLNKQDELKRYVLHVLHYIPERRGKMFDVLEDVIQIHSLEVSVEIDESVKGILLVPQSEKIDYNENNGRVHFVIPCINGHQMVEIQYMKGYNL